MGWTHDYGDAARNRHSATAPIAYERGRPHEGRHHPGRAIGIPHILRRRARWMSARLRHQRS
ncbi:hypothetical protein [Streptomyces sp. NPDC048442]|uniref:hypothetical protein n=1 Tax=Streptomyces sp. NPDC048442 TaxID=3154823 RepID=UPI00342E32A5